VSTPIPSIRSAGLLIVAMIAALPQELPQGRSPAMPRGPSSAGQRPVAPAPARQVFQRQLDSLVAAIDTLSRRVEAGRPAAAQRAFRDARAAYKRVEGLLAFYAPAVIVTLEGPLEADGGPEAEARPYNLPGLFPVVEGAIFPRYIASARRETLNRLRAMREPIVMLRSMSDDIDVDDAAVLEAGRAELARVSTLDIAGFDSDRQDDALLDAASALDGIRSTILALAPSDDDAAASAGRHADSSLGAAADYLRRHARFEQMDRLTFLARYSLPASHALAALRSARGIALTGRTALWREDAASVYDSGAFDPTAYSPRRVYTPTAGRAIVALGGRLFTDPRLSGPGTRSCASCHIPTHAFTDALPTRAAIGPVADRVAATDGTPPPRRTPTLLNAALQPTLFADGRARALEQQIGLVLSNPDEMASSIDTAVRRVAADSSYRAAFAHAFRGTADSAVTSLSLRTALAAYVRSLTPLHAPFDRAVRGDTTAIDAAARRGFTVFMGKGRCGTCHFAPLFNGTAPPDYRATDPEIIGVPTRPVLHGAQLDPDQGRGLIDRVESHRFAFQVPSVRNAALTAPYMHNGVYRSLREVIAFYNAGGGRGIGIDLAYQTLYDHPLGLTPREQRELIAFLRALTDTAGTVPPIGASAASP